MDLKKTDEAKAEAPVPAPKPLPKVRINAICARIAATCMARMDIRYYLNGLYVEPRPEGGVVIVGTDGHRLCAVIDKDGEASGPVILRVQDMVQHLPKPKDTEKFLDGVPGKKLTLVLEELRGKPVLVLQDTMNRMLRLSGEALVEGKFPEWRRSVLNMEWAALKQQCLNLYQPHYVHETASLLDSRGRYSPVPYQEESGRVILWHFWTHPHVLLAVMPMRDGNAMPTKDWQGNFWPDTAPKDTKAKAKDATPA